MQKVHHISHWAMHQMGPHMTLATHQIGATHIKSITGMHHMGPHIILVHASYSPHIIFLTHHIAPHIIFLCIITVPPISNKSYDAGTRLLCVIVTQPDIFAFQLSKAQFKFLSYVPIHILYPNVFKSETSSQY